MTFSFVLSPSNPRYITRNSNAISSINRINSKNVIPFKVFFSFFLLINLGAYRLIVFVDMLKVNIDRYCQCWELNSGRQIRLSYHLQFITPPTHILLPNPVKILIRFTYHWPLYTIDTSLWDQTRKNEKNKSLLQNFVNKGYFKLSVYRCRFFKLIHLLQRDVQD